MVYFDYNATTPLDQRVYAKMLPYFAKAFANPSSIYRTAQTCQRAVEDARCQLALLLHAQPQEIVFTSGGTESVNLAIKGAVSSLGVKHGHIITTLIEHPAVPNTCRHLQTQGFSVTYLGVDKTGRVDVKDLKNAIRKATILVSVMHANNEIGTIQPIEEIARVCNKRKILFHSDAVQTAGKLTIDVRDLGVDMLSVSAHKFYGPKGAGALYVRAGVKLTPLFHGGPQERQLRAGTENVAAIVGMGEAARIVRYESDEYKKRVLALRDVLEKKICSEVNAVQVNGHLKNRLYNTSNITIDNVQADTLVINLDFKKICVSSGSACASGSPEPSHVLQAIGLTEAQARSSIRLSLGRFTSQKEVDLFLKVFVSVVKRLRAMASSRLTESGI